MINKMKQVLLHRIFWIILLAVLSMISIMIGVKDFSLRGMFSGNADDINLVLISRIPRLISIIVTGASLSVAGLIMQTITNNKFVSPSTAGTMEWCKFGVMIAILVFGGKSSLVKMGVAFICALFGTLLFMQVLTRLQFKNAIIVPLVGMMMGNVIGSITSFFAYKYDIIQNMSSWLQGNFSLIIKGRYELLYIGIPFFVIAYVYANKFTIAGMGESFSKNLGLNHKRVVMAGMIIVAFITATVVVTVGSIPFLGLIIPNIVAIYKGDNIKNTLFDIALLGSIFILICDILGRIIIYPYEVSISVVVSVVGSIIFLVILFWRNKHGR